MSMNPLNDISSVYMQEVLKPQLGEKKPEPAAGGSKVKKGETTQEASAKRVRQAVYDIRYRARREDVPIEQAFNQYSGKSGMTGPEKAAVKEKLGLTSGGGTTSESVQEAVETKKFKVRVTDKATGKTYVRYATREKISALRSNPNISSVEMTSYGDPYEGEKKKGKATSDVTSGKGLAKKDYDGDGKLETSKQEWKGSRDKAIKAAIDKKKLKEQTSKDIEIPSGDVKPLVKKAVKRIDADNDGDVDKDDPKEKGMGEFVPSPDGKKKVKTSIGEGFSNWRQELSEVIDSEKKEKEVDVKKVNNYSGKNKCITLNPEISEAIEVLGGELIEMVELDEKALSKQQQKFMGMVYAVKKGEMKAPSAAVAKAAAGMSKKSARDFAKTKHEGLPKKKVEEAVTQIPGRENNPPEGTTAKQDDVQRKQMLANKQKMLQKQMMLQRQQLQLQKQGKLPMGHAVEEVEYDIEEGVRPTPVDKPLDKAAFKKRRKSLKGYEQRGDARKRGHEGKEWYNSGRTYSPDEAKSGRAKMDDEERRTRHRSAVDPDDDNDNNYSADKTKNPKKLRKQKAMGELGEAVYGGEKQEPKDTRYTVTAADKKANTTAYKKYKAGDKRYKAADHLGEEMIDELNRSERETGIDTKTGKPTAKGGAKDDKAFTHVKKMMRKMEGTPAGQRKKVPGKKPPTAGQYGSGVKSPAQKVAQRRADAKRAQDNMSSRFD